MLAKYHTSFLTKDQKVQGVCKTWTPLESPRKPPEPSWNPPGNSWNPPRNPYKYYFNILPTLFFHLYDERISKNELGSGN